MPLRQPQRSILLSTALAVILNITRTSRHDMTKQERLNKRLESRSVRDRPWTMQCSKPLICEPVSSLQKRITRRIIQQPCAGTTLNYLRRLVMVPISPMVHQPKGQRYRHITTVSGHQSITSARATVSKHRIHHRRYSCRKSTSSKTASTAPSSPF